MAHMPWALLVGLTFVTIMTRLRLMRVERRLDELTAKVGAVGRNQ